jgi:site-specific recombinase
VRGAVEISAGVTLFAESGILSQRGFVGEIVDRVYERVLPAPPRPGDLRDVFEKMFCRKGDATWAEAMPLEAWQELGSVLDGGAGPGKGVIGVLRPGMLGAIEVLAVRIAAEGSASELLHVDPNAARHDSPFLALQREVANHLEAVEAGAAVADATHARVLLDQCLRSVERLRSIGRRRGTSAWSSSCAGSSCCSRPRKRSRGPIAFASGRIFSARCCGRPSRA